MSVLIVDDEPLARNCVRECLESHKDIEIVGECSSGIQAVGHIRRLKPDVVFLDVEMPDISGFEVLSRLQRSERPFVVLLATNCEYAFCGFEADAIDYVLKPVNSARLQKTLSRMRERIEEKAASAAFMRLQETAVKEYLKRFCVRTGKRVRIVPVETVSWIGAAGDYVALHVGQRIFLIQGSLESVERQLDPERFVRVHRSTIVATSKIAAIAALPSRDYELLLIDETRVRVSRRYKQKLFTRLAISTRRGAVLN